MKVVMVALLVGSGVVGGSLVMFAIGVVPVFRSLAPVRWAELHRMLDTHIDHYMPAVTVATIVLGVVFVIFEDGAPRALGVAGVVFTIGVAVISQALNLPINRTIGSWEGDPPAEAAEVRERWVRIHLLRTVSGVLALVALASAVVAR